MKETFVDVFHQVACSACDDINEILVRTLEEQEIADMFSYQERRWPYRSHLQQYTVRP
jgi:hypothetical protein